jgi:hypothetical protein
VSDLEGKYLIDFGRHGIPPGQYFDARHYAVQNLVNWYADRS